jgi:hypothetical protein
VYIFYEVKNNNVFTPMIINYDTAVRLTEIIVDHKKRGLKKKKPILLRAVDKCLIT